MSTNKLVTLAHLRKLAERVKSEDAELAAKLEQLATTVEGIVSVGGEANILEGVKINGAALNIAEKMVDILIAAGSENGTISVNGADVAVTGLQALAYKAQISESDLDTALTAVIAAKATNTDLQALVARVEAIEGADYQNGEQVAQAIAEAIAGASHLKKEVVTTLPEPADADENTLYLILNAETGHYDIHGLVNGKVERLDDTSLDLSGYSTTEQMNTAIAAAIEALSIGDYAKLTDLNAALDRITAAENKFANYYTKDEMNTVLAGYATDEEAAAAGATAAADAIAANTASDEEANAALDEVWDENT